MARVSTHLDSSEGGFSIVLQGMSPMGDKTSQSAEQYEAFDRETLEVFHKTIEQIFAIIGDNCRITKALVDRLGFAFVGWASHISNVAVKRVCDGNDSLIEKRNELMKKLR